VLEVRKVQPEEVPEHLAPEHRVHPVPGMQHEVLAQPAHPGAEEHEHRQPDGDGDEGAVRLVNDDLVDHHLGTQRRGETDQLDEE
jgi:hypothetical protein